MSTLQSSIPVAASTRLLDKYVLPKVALTVIIIASFIGTWLTMSTHGAGTWFQVSTRWLHLVSFAALAGIYVEGAVRSPDKRAGAAALLYPIYGRFLCPFSPVGTNRFAPVCGHGRLRPFRFAAWGVGWLVWLEIAILAMIVLAIGADAYGRGRNDPFAERNLARLTLLFLLLNALVQAGFDVILAQDGDTAVAGSLAAPGRLWPLVWRAVWNIFITVPAARSIVSPAGCCRRQPAAGAV